MKGFSRTQKTAPKQDEVGTPLVDMASSIALDQLWSAGVLTGEEQDAQLEKGLEESVSLMAFALDYWVGREFPSAEETRVGREHLAKDWERYLAIDGDRGQALVHTLRQRIKDYSEVMRQATNDESGLASLRAKFTGFCGMPDDSRYLAAAAQILERGEKMARRLPRPS